MIMIGKISGIDWSKAPPDATHVHGRLGDLLCYDTVFKKDMDFKTNTCLMWYDGHWRLQVGLSFARNYTSREEDLGVMNKTFSVGDLKTGMRITCVSGRQYIVLLNTDKYGDIGVAWGRFGYIRIVDLDFTNDENKDSCVRVLKVEKPNYHIFGIFSEIDSTPWETIWEYEESSNKELEELNEAIKAHEKSLEELKAKARQLGSK